MSKLFIALSNDDVKDMRNSLVRVLLKANIEVKNPESLDKEWLKDASFLDDCSSAIILLGSMIEINSDAEVAKNQFELLLNHQKNHTGFKIFIWCPPIAEGKSLTPMQSDFIDYIRNNITQNMSFTNVNNPLQFVDDIRSSFVNKIQAEISISSSEIFLVCNELDEIEANEVIDMLSDVIPVEKLTIIQDSDEDYSLRSSLQIQNSKLAVIYFRESSDWAIPFVQQIWKKVGGASSKTPILLIGTNDPAENANKKFTAPKVTSMILNPDLIPLEIKMQFDKIIGEA